MNLIQKNLHKPYTGGQAGKEGLMEYRIEYAGGRCRNFAHNRKDLLEWLKVLKNEEISDIRKIHKLSLIHI